MKSAFVCSSLLVVCAFGCGGPLPGAVNGDAPVGSLAQAVNAPITCALRTHNGHYLTAVDGGGRTSDVIHTDATQVRAWEKFTLEDPGQGYPIHYGIKTVNGHFLTAVGGGGRTSDVLHTDATRKGSWESFTFVELEDGTYAIETNNGHFLTAVGAGGLTSNAIHSDATRIGDWERFDLICGY